tara:strand:+ start:2173 stop:2550 length:378 start_codon:yes stop_codon:yes gene_type:complete
VISPDKDPARIKLTEDYKKDLEKQYLGKANGITTYYILAQQQFYNAEYEDALYLINKAIAIKETPDIIALKGSIYLGLGSIDLFTQNWKRALEMDKNIPIPNSSVIIKELQNQGLINDKLERNFK